MLRFAFLGAWHSYASMHVREADDENWKVRLIEEEFMQRMWDISEA